jgi:excisionase family DNA binding protein
MAILNTEETMDKFQIGSYSTIFALFKRKGSPAFKTGKNWKVDEEEFKTYLKKLSESSKG